MRNNVIKVALKSAVTFITFAINCQDAVGQSPFDYGQNERVYFISTEMRKSLGIGVMYDISQQEANTPSGMNANWEITVIDFSDQEITKNWHILDTTDDYEFDFGDVVHNSRFVNGTMYYFEKGELSSYGGHGYGSFYWTDITRPSPTFANLFTYCTGHCGPMSETFRSHNIYNDDGQLAHTIVYPKRYPALEYDEDSESEIDSSLLNSEAAQQILRDRDTTVKTKTYAYDAQGRLARIDENNIDAANVAKTLLSYNGFHQAKFHQIFIGDFKMEKFLRKNLGMLPELVLIEIYRHGVFSFVLNKQTGTYFSGSTVVLE